jgi:hypothetical protein
MKSQVPPVEPSQIKSSRHRWKKVLAVLKRYWWVYPLWWIIKIAVVAVFGVSIFS